MAAWSDHEGVYEHPGNIYGSDGSLIGRKDISDRDFLAPFLDGLADSGDFSPGASERSADYERQIDARVESFQARHGVSTPDATPLHPCPTCNTAMRDECPGCAVKSEPFPLEVWTFFSDADLDQLVVDACAEMGRREIARRNDA